MGTHRLLPKKTEEVHHAKRKESKSCFYPFRVPDSAHLPMGHTAAGFIRHGGREQHALSYHQLCLALLPGHDPVRSVLPVDRVVLQIQKHTAGAGRSQAEIQQKRLVLHALLRRYGRRSGLLGSGRAHELFCRAHRRPAERHRRGHAFCLCPLFSSLGHSPLGQLFRAGAGTGLYAVPQRAAGAHQFRVHPPHRGKKSPRMVGKNGGCALRLCYGRRGSHFFGAGNPAA